MTDTLRFLIVDGYPKDSRDELQAAGMKLAWELYANLLQAHLPDAAYDVLLPSDPGSTLPTGAALADYAAVLWTGCNLTIYHTDDERVTRQIALAREAYELGVPGFGSCWGVQMAAVAAGGEVAANPKGREMGVARSIHLTLMGEGHPMYEDKPPVFCGYISHVDQVTKLPEGGKILATNDFTQVQSLAVDFKQGTFWGTQYHPEYDLHEMARLIVAREPKLLPEDFFASSEELQAHVVRLEALHAEPTRKDLRWQLAIGDDLLDEGIRRCEFRNFIEQVVLPRVAGGGPGA